MNVHPKYLKVVKIGYFKRSVNAFTALMGALISTVTCLMRAPVDMIQAFCVTEEQMVDNEKMLKDFVKQEREAKKAQKKTGREGPTYHVEHHIAEEEEEWKKAHKEEFGDNN